MDKLGIVSNCWQHLINNGRRLSELIRDSIESGLYYVELRQGACGEFEEIGDPGVVQRLQTLAQEYPQGHFHYAMSFPFLGDWKTGEQLFNKACVAAELLNPQAPELRIVDVTTTTEEGRLVLPKSTIALAQLADELAQRNIRLTVEHARQEWSLFQNVCEKATEISDSRNIWLCVDPANLALAGETAKINHVLDTIDISKISMMHVKQYRDGRIDTKLDRGDVDWQATVESLQSRGYDKSILFELRSSLKIQAEIDLAQRKWSDWVRQQGNLA